MVANGEVKFHGVLIALMEHLFKVGHQLKVVLEIVTLLFTDVLMKQHVTTTQMQQTMMEVAC